MTSDEAEQAMVEAALAWERDYMESINNRKTMMTAPYHRLPQLQARADRVARDELKSRYRLVGLIRLVRKMRREERERV